MNVKESCNVKERRTVGKEIDCHVAEENTEVELNLFGNESFN